MRVFATDVDSVLLDITTPILHHFAKKYPTKEVYAGGMHHWDLSLCYGVPKEEIDEMWGDALGGRCLPEPGAEDFVKGLHAEGWKVVAVTARIPRFQAALLRDVAHLGLDDVIFAHDKEETLRSLDARAFIDDKLGNIQQAQRAGVTDLFLYDQPWNFSLDLNVPYMRVFTLDEVFNG